MDVYKFAYICIFEENFHKINKIVKTFWVDKYKYNRYLIAKLS